MFINIDKMTDKVQQTFYKLKEKCKKVRGDIEK